MLDSTGGGKKCPKEDERRLILGTEVGTSGARRDVSNTSGRKGIRSLERREERILGCRLEASLFPLERNALATWEGC